MIMKKRLPAVRRRSPPPRHVFGYAGLAYIDPDLEQLTLDPRGSHNGFAMFISRINWRSSSDTAGRPGRRLDFQRPLNSLLTVGRESEGANLRAPR